MTASRHLTETTTHRNEWSPYVVFGDQSSFAIEVKLATECELRLAKYIFFRFWIGSIPVGDWGELIRGDFSARTAEDYINTSPARHERHFEGVCAKRVLEQVYDNWNSEYSHGLTPVLPSRRDRYHIENIGLDATLDACAVILVSENVTFDRIIAKNLREQRIVIDVLIPIGAAEQVFQAYVEWICKDLSKLDE